MTNVEAKVYKYETISSFVTRLKTLRGEDKININSTSIYFKNIEYNDKLEIIDNKWKGTAAKWNVVYVQIGTATISQVIKLLEPHVEKNASALIQIYFDEKTSKLIKSGGETSVTTYTITTLDTKEMDPTKTHIVSDDVLRITSKKEFDEKIEKYNALTENNAFLLKQYLIVICKLYPLLSIYVIGIKVFTSFDGVKNEFPHIIQLDGYFEKKSENLWFCYYFIAQLTEFNNIAMKEKEKEKEKEKQEKEKMEKGKQEKKEQERLAKEKEEKEEQERLAKEAKEEQERLAKEKEAKEKAEKEGEEKKKSEEPETILWYEIGGAQLSEAALKVKYSKIPFEIIQKCFSERKIHDYCSSSNSAPYKREIIITCPKIEVLNLLVEFFEC